MPSSRGTAFSLEKLALAAKKTAKVLPKVEVKIDPETRKLKSVMLRWSFKF